eukprot:CAMPEP_0197849578 /NCGR_PEP_ID=MMETSP1438-20131217/12646_1 /TAXON_ID=1461541 /ORGANISM="Pterosperma sp., Strain CCMP1384" /LENGTH=231 /DNA_ID=CAMNT_0043462339 /DNA_START=98 /DNA_END=794 /DNA_ORIENTATION=+
MTSMITSNARPVAAQLSGRSQQAARPRSLTTTAFRTSQHHRTALSGLERQGACQVLRLGLKSNGQTRKRTQPTQALFGLGEEVPAMTEGRLIGGATRTTIATVLNKVIDVPIMNELQEQILLYKVVELIANGIEELCEEMLGLNELDGMDKKELDKWRDAKVAELNEAIDLPILNEMQEGIAIQFVVDKVIESHIEGYEHESGSFLKLFDEIRRMLQWSTEIDYHDIDPNY